MMSEISPAYWNDITAYCNDILVDQPQQDVKLLFIAGSWQEASWQAAAENTMSHLRKGTHRYLGGMLRKEKYWVLEIKEPISEVSPAAVQSIWFDPDKKAINLARFHTEGESSSLAPDSAAAVSPFSRLIDYMKEFHAASKMWRSGLYVPPVDTYDMLWYELRSGARAVRGKDYHE